MLAVLTAQRQTVMQGFSFMYSHGACRQVGAARRSLWHSPQHRRGDGRCGGGSGGSGDGLAR